ncbi:glycosyltransferase [Microbacterium aurum]
MTEIYVPGIGQYDNIGDIILRRQLLRWLEPYGRLHVFVGDAVDGYAESLGLDQRHVVYRSFAQWYQAAMADAIRGRGAYVFKPGEIQITMPGLKEHLSLLPLVLALKARGRPVIRVGAGARGFEKLPRLLMQPSIIAADLVAWRDPRTAAFLGRGEVMPDLAFGEGPERPRGPEERTLLVVSMRSDRDFPSEAWLEAVRVFARVRGLQIVTVVQVERDADRSRELAERLGGVYDPWAGADHDGHEAHLRSLYRRASVAVSDRLHVLITATTEGAAPSAPLVDDSDKIERHFDAAGITDVAVRTAGLSTTGICSAIAHAADSWPRVEEGLQHARVQLESIRRRIGDLLMDTTAAADNSRGAAVWHVGRSGEVAGGMTQVVNAYLAWPFANVRQRLLVSRNGTAGFRELLLMGAAFARAPFLGRRDRTVVVVHLSQGGSFVREGLLLRWLGLLGYGTVAHLHGSSFVDYAQANGARVRRVLRSARVVVALSEQTVAAVRELLPAARVELLPNAVPEGHDRPKQRLVVFGGGVSRRKGVDVLLDAWERAAPPAEWQLHIAGPVLDPDVVLVLPEGAHGLGALDHSALMELLERSEIAVLPSRDEAMPMFILEALARRNAVISTTVGGIPAVLGDGAGTLVPPGDVDDSPARCAFSRTTTLRARLWSPPEPTASDRRSRRKRSIHWSSGCG